MVKLEGSAKWPSDPEAVAKTQLAFCLHAAQCVREGNPGVRVIASPEAVDLLFDGFAFRLHALPPKPTAGERDQHPPLFLRALRAYPCACTTAQLPH